MSKKLQSMELQSIESILNKVPPATVDNPAIKREEVKIEPFPQQNDEIFYRIVAEVPRYVKVQIKQLLSKNPEETERTVLLKALRAIGVEVRDEDILDQRKNKRKKI